MSTALSGVASVVERSRNFVLWCFFPSHSVFFFFFGFRFFLSFQTTLIPSASLNQHQLISSTSLPSFRAHISWRLETTLTERRQVGVAMLSWTRKTVEKKTVADFADLTSIDSNAPLSLSFARAHLLSLTLSLSPIDDAINKPSNTQLLPLPRRRKKKQRPRRRRRPKLPLPKLPLPKLPPPLLLPLLLPPPPLLLRNRPPRTRARPPPRVPPRAKLLLLLVTTKTTTTRTTRMRTW